MVGKPDTVCSVLQAGPLVFPMVPQPGRGRPVRGINLQIKIEDTSPAILLHRDYF